MAEKGFIVRGGLGWGWRVGNFFLENKRILKKYPEVAAVFKSETCWSVNLSLTDNDIDVGMWL